MTWEDWLLRGFAVFGIVVFTLAVTKNGIAWVVAKVAGIFSVAKADFVGLEARVVKLEETLNPVPSLLVPASKFSAPPGTTITVETPTGTSK